MALGGSGALAQKVVAVWREGQARPLLGLHVVVGQRLLFLERADVIYRDDCLRSRSLPFLGDGEKTDRE